MGQGEKVIARDIINSTLENTSWNSTKIATQVINCGKCTYIIYWSSLDQNVNGQGPWSCMACMLLIK